MSSPHTLGDTSGEAAHGGEEHRAISVGCAELPPGMARKVYFQKLQFLETRLPGDETPGERILRRWRQEAGGPGRFALVAPRDLCDPSGAREASIAAEKRVRAGELARAAAELGAAAVVFPTPPEITPGSAHRDRLRWLFEEVASSERFGDIVRVWQADGLWRPAVAAGVAEELGVVAAQDPLAEDSIGEGPVPEAGPVAYARVTGLGRSGRPLAEDDLARLAEWLEPCRRAFVAFATTARLRDAQGLARWVGGSIGPRN